MHRTYLADIERGGRNITLRSVENLADALQISVERLLAASEDSGARGQGRRAKLDTIGSILLVEDDQNDAELMLRAFARAGVANPIKVIADGQEAVNYLRHRGSYARRRRVPLPDLVLLDLNLPALSGIEVLRQLKADERTRSIPVVVLTVSRHDENVIECGRLGAENYIIKPVGFESFCEVLTKLCLRWALLKPQRRGKRPAKKSSV